MLTVHDTPARDGSRGDRGFTLVEVIVAMVILAIVLVAGIGFIVNGFAGSSKSLNERHAIQQANRTMESMESAIRATKSPDRDETVLPDTTSLSKALLQGTAVQGSRGAAGPSSTKVTLDVNDVVYADSRRIVLRSNVLPSAGVECVEYVVQVTGDNRSLVRNVWYNAAAPAPPTCVVPPATPPRPDVTETLISTVGENDASPSGGGGGGPR